MIDLNNVKIPQDWKELLKNEILSPYFAEIKRHYLNALAEKQIIYPKASQIFYAFQLTPLEQVKIVILGQDPYHSEYVINGEAFPQAMGLSFSVPRSAPLPPSLQNIYKELRQSLHISTPTHGDLSSWAKSGVLLLNAILSVQSHHPASHRHFGWESFTDSVIRAISAHKNNVVFMLWGNYAKKKASLIDEKKHKIILAPHPSPLARGFVGSGVFVEANKYLHSIGKPPLSWEIL